MSKGPRTDVIALGALATAAALGIGLLIAKSASGGGANPLSAVPADSFLVVSIDVAALAQSPLGEAFVGELQGDAGARAGALLGVESITATCGFDPLPHLRGLAIAIPEGGEHGDFGVAASGTLGKDALASCAKAVIAKRGGEATTRQVGSFTVVADARTPGGGEIAFRDGGPTLLGRGAWLMRMIDAADGRTPSTLAAGDAHGALRADLATRDTDAEAVLATALLPHTLRERLQGEVAKEGQGQQGRGNKAMEGVLGVSAAALGLHAGRPHEDSRILAELRCDDDAGCDAVSTLILHTRLTASGNLGYRLLGLGPLIDNLEVQRATSPGSQRPALFVKTRAPVDDLARMLERALAPRGSSLPKKARPPPPAADEVIQPRPDAAP